MVVEPESLCGMTGRMVQARDGATWAEEFARLQALRTVVRDDGTGLGQGVSLDRVRRRAAGLADLDDTLDVFPTLREGGRALRKTWGSATHALERADAAQSNPLSEAASKETSLYDRSYEQVERKSSWTNGSGIT
jgi:hypothetical protein